MRVAAVQFAPGLDKPANRAVLAALIEDAADDGASLVVAPEGAMHDFGPKDLALAGIAETLDGPFVTALSVVAARRGVRVIAGMFEAVPDDPARVYNTVVAVGPDGLIGSYRKQHLFDALGWTESDRLAAGVPGEQLVVECEGFRVGVLTCYDVRFPELARALVDAGTTMLAVPSAWVAGPRKAAQFRALATARAIENVCYLVAAVAPPPTYTGESCVIEPFGEVLAELGTASGMCAADVSPERVASCREQMPSLRNRRWAVTPR